MARESLFNILENLSDITHKSFLDLFAGSGIVGIEAISRGARKSTFVDINLKNLQSIKSNLLEFKIENYAKTIRSNFKSYLNKKEKFDLIFADPPYDKDFYGEILMNLKKNNNLNENGYLILESRSNKLIDPFGFELIKEKRISGSKFLILQNAQS